MLFGAELLNLFLYCVQQLGVALGLGAQVIMLVAYIQAMRDGVIDDTEAQFLRATRGVLWFAFACIVVSGLGISALHAAGGQEAILVTPAYLFKSLLIAVVILLTALLPLLPEVFAEGLLGGTWFALFVVHILAPVTTWANLLTFFAVWMVGFNLIWYVIAFTTRGHNPEAKPIDKAAVVKPEPITVSEATKKHRSFFSFFSFMRLPKKAPAPAVKAEIKAEAKPEVKVEERKEEVKTEPKVPAPAPITLDVPANFKPIVVDAAPKATPTPVPQTHLSVEKMPGSIATDTPFLPQVPPLQPIPVIPPPGATPANASNPAVSGASPAPLPSEIKPEIKLGLNVMPKGPDEVKK